MVFVGSGRKPRSSIISPYRIPNILKNIVFRGRFDFHHAQHHHAQHHRGLKTGSKDDHRLITLSSTNGNSQFVLIIASLLVFRLVVIVPILSFLRFSLNAH